MLFNDKKEGSDNANIHRYGRWMLQLFCFQDSYSMNRAASSCTKPVRILIQEDCHVSGSSAFHRVFQDSVVIDSESRFAHRGGIRSYSLTVGLCQLGLQLVVLLLSG